MNVSVPDKPGVDDIQTLSRIFEQRLQKSNAGDDYEDSSGERTELIAKFGGLARRLSSLMQITDDTEEDHSVSLDTVLERLMGIIADALDSERSTLFMYDRETDELFSPRAHWSMRFESIAMKVSLVWCSRAASQSSSMTPMMTPVLIPKLTV